MTLVPLGSSAYTMIVETDSTMYPTKTVTFISVSLIIADNPALNFISEYLDDVSYGDAPHTLITKEHFLNVVEGMCNEDAIPEEVFNNVCDSLKSDFNSGTEIFIDLET